MFRIQLEATHNYNLFYNSLIWGRCGFLLQLNRRTRYHLFFFLSPKTRIRVLHLMEVLNFRACIMFITATSTEQTVFFPASQNHLSHERD